MIKKSFPVLFFLFSISLFAQNSWNHVWDLDQLPFQDPQAGSEMSIVKAGFDTDDDGWGEFLCAYTGYDSNYVMLYEATADNAYDLVWFWKYPVGANAFPGIAIGDLDNNGTIEIITTLPSKISEDPNPQRIWVFEWSGVQGENKYGRYNGDTFTPSNFWNFNLADNNDFRPYSLVVDDIDNDSQNELIVGVRQSESDGSGTREVIVASVTGQFSQFASWQVEYNLKGSWGGSLYSVSTGDLDGDGKKEIHALVWNNFTLKIIECNGDRDYTEAFNVDELTPGTDHGALDGVKTADIDGDGDNEMFIASMLSSNSLFVVSDVTDLSTMSNSNIKEFYHIPVTASGRLRALDIADSDGDGNLSLLIAGERNGQIFDLEYNGSGDPADSANWTLTIAYDIFEDSGFNPEDTLTVTPRFFYGSAANDMDKDGKNEYVFVNFSTDFDVWQDDAYIRIIEAGSITSVEDENIIPTKIALEQNYPNPFNPSTKISFSLVESGYVSLKVYDILGNEVASIVDGDLNSGNHTKVFNAVNLSSGVYFYTLKTNNFKETKKLMLMK